MSTTQPPVKQNQWNLFQLIPICLGAGVGLLIAALALAIAGYHWLSLGSTLIAILLQIFLIPLILKSRNQYLIKDDYPELADLDAARREFEDYREEVTARLTQETDRLSAESRKVEDRFRVIHEWLDSPEWIDLQQDPVEQAPQELLAARTGKSRHELIKCDREVAKILEDQAEIIYEKIRRNDYVNDRKFDMHRFREDLLTLATRIAKVYHPELDNPLLHTSPDQLARALNRIGLHLLVVFDQLPLDLQRYNIQQTYDTISHAVKAYGHYKKASPYLNWASRGLLLGRMVTSINPIALGLWWGASELGKMGATKIATKMIDRQAIGLLHSLIRVVGYEVAGIYGGDFRYRDANWCYGVEISQLLSAMPKSREGMKRGLEELTRLQLRNEYDRLALYRAISVSKAISRKHVDVSLLTEEERRQIADRIEQLYTDAVHGQSTAAAEAWRKEVQDHLGFQFTTQKAKHADPTERKLQIDQQIAECLIGFLRNVKQRSADETEKKLSSSSISVQLISEESLKKFHSELESQSTPIRFQPPDLDPNDPRVPLLFEQLTKWNGSVTPYSPEYDLLLLELGQYFRMDPKDCWETIATGYQTKLMSQQPQHSERLEKWDENISRAIVLLRTEDPDFPLPTHIFERVAVLNSAGNTISPDAELEFANLTLLAAENWLILISTGDQTGMPIRLWKSDPSTQWENTSTMMTARIKLTGGVWSLPESPITPKSIQLEAPVTARFQSYYEIILNQLLETT